MALPRVRHLTVVPGRPALFAVPSCGASEACARPTIPSGRRGVPLGRTLPGGSVLGRTPEKPQRRQLVGIDGGRVA